MSHQIVLPLSDDYRRPIRVALCQQIPIGVLCLLLLDGGGTAKFCGVIMLGFWLGAAIIMVRRPMNPTTIDRILIKYSFIPLLVVAGMIAELMRL